MRRRDDPRRWRWQAASGIAVVLVTASAAVPPPAGRYSRWKNGPSDDASHFPIGVWLQDPAKAAAFRDIGVNLYVGLFKGPTAAQLRDLARAGMPVICGQNEVGLASPQRDVIRGWAQVDEPDNAQLDGATRKYGPPIPPAEIERRYTRMRERDATRPVFLNFGPGMAYAPWIGRGAGKGRQTDYPDYLRGADIVAHDIYPVAGPPAKEVAGKLEYVGLGVEKLVRWAAGKKIVWNFIECTHIHGAAMPTPEQVRSEVWMSIVHGSMGILYFVHEWHPTFREDAVFRYPEMVATLRSINTRIRDLAPVLNRPTVADGATAIATAPDIPIRLMVKRHERAIFVFAVAMRAGTTKALFEVRGLRGRQEAEVLDEERRLPVLDGRFEDAFTDYAVHLYRIRE